MSRKQNKILRRRLAGSYLSSVISITLVLLIVGSVSLLVFNAPVVENYVRENIKITVLLKKDTPAQKAIAFQREIETRPYVRSTRYVSVQQGTKEMVEMLGEDFLEVFATSPVPSSVEVGLHGSYVTPECLERICEELVSFPIVDEVDANSVLVGSLGGSLRKIALVLAVLALLLLFISVVLIAGTVRLSLYSNRFTIHTMRLVGASRGFIARPYIAGALGQGFIASLLAIGLISGAIYFLSRPFPQILGLFQPTAALASAVLVLVFGMGLCFFCASAVVSRIVRLNNDELYG